jgi:hypothetical protein
VQKIREVLGTGSNTTIAEHLKVWRDEYAKKTIHHLPANMPKELISAIEVLWQTAMEQAQNQLAEYKHAVESECEVALQRERNAEKSVTDIKLKLQELSVTLEQEIANKQKLNIELAVITERQIKQEEALATQKNHYEDRLKRVYEEKDIHITQCRQLQNEVTTLQERLTLQTEQHHKTLAQQSALHEQSENRWLKFVAQAKQETKETYKKLENLSKHNDEQIKNLKTTLSDLQQSSYEKNAQLKVSLEQINQLKQEIKFLETENIKARSTIIKLEEEQKSIHALIKNKSNQEKLGKSKTEVLS